MDLNSITPDPAGLKALSHPTRLRMLGLLRAEGPATATSLAARLGLNTGATSYHLRQLALHGFVEDDAQRGTGRERWWRAKHQSTYTDRSRLTRPEEHETLDAYIQAVAVVYTQTLQAAIEETSLLPQEWRDASTLSDYQYRLTAQQAKMVVQRLNEVLGAVEDDPGEDAATFVVQFQAFPRPGVLAREPGPRPGAAS